LAAVKRAGIRQLGLGGGVDPFQFYEWPGAWKRDRCIIENSTIAIASSLRGAGGVRRSAWLHNRFWSSGARRLNASSLANALELAAHASRTSVHCVVPNSACANNGHGVDAPVVDRRPNAAANEFWARDWLSYGSNTLGAVAGAVLGEGYLIGAFRFLRLYVVSSPTDVA